MTIDRDDLAADLEQLGLYAIAGAVRKNTVPSPRVQRSLQRTRRKRLEAGDRAGAKAVNGVLARHWGKP
jgi:hypothetical protein